MKRTSIEKSLNQLGRLPDVAGEQDHCRNKAFRKPAFAFSCKQCRCFIHSRCRYKSMVSTGVKKGRAGMRTFMVITMLFRRSAVAKVLMFRRKAGFITTAWPYGQCQNIDGKYECQVLHVTNLMVFFYKQINPYHLRGVF